MFLVRQQFTAQTVGGDYFHCQTGPFGKTMAVQNDFTAIGQVNHQASTKHQPSINQASNNHQTTINQASNKYIFSMSGAVKVITPLCLLVHWKK